MQNHFKNTFHTSSFNYTDNFTSFDFFLWPRWSSMSYNNEPKLANKVRERVCDNVARNRNAFKWSRKFSVPTFLVQSLETRFVEILRLFHSFILQLGKLVSLGFLFMQLLPLYPESRLDHGSCANFSTTLRINHLFYLCSL